ncbi:MAG: histidine kinase, partial [Clostridium sp.]
MSYLISTFSRGLLSNKFYIYFILIEVGLSIYVSLNFLEPVIIFGCISILEYFSSKNDNYIFGVVISLAPLSLVMNFRNIKELALITLLSIIIIITNDKIFKKISKDEEISGKQRKEIYNLENRLLMEKDIQEQLIHTVKLEERNKISGELHDKIGHTISGTLLQLEATKLIMDI